MSLLNNISKIITNNSISFNESIIYINGIGDVYHGIEKVEIQEHNQKLNKKRKRNDLQIEIEKIYEFKKKNGLQLNKVNMNKNKINFSIGKKEEKDYTINRKMNENENNNIINNIIDINESIDKNNKSSFLNNSGDMNDDYYKCFRTIKKYSFPNIN